MAAGAGDRQAGGGRTEGGMGGAGAAPGRIVGACRVRPPLRRELLSRQAVASSVRAGPC